MCSSAQNCKGGGPQGQEESPIYHLSRKRQADHRGYLHEFLWSLRSADADFPEAADEDRTDERDTRGLDMGVSFIWMDPSGPLCKMARAFHQVHESKHREFSPAGSRRAFLAYEKHCSDRPRGRKPRRHCLSPPARIGCNRLTSRSWVRSRLTTPEVWKRGSETTRTASSTLFVSGKSSEMLTCRPLPCETRSKASKPRGSCR